MNEVRWADEAMHGIPVHFPDHDFFMGRCHGFVQTSRIAEIRTCTGDSRIFERNPWEYDVPSSQIVNLVVFSVLRRYPSARSKSIRESKLHSAPPGMRMGRGFHLWKSWLKPRCG